MVLSDSSWDSEEKKRGGAFFLLKEEWSRGLKKGKKMRNAYLWVLIAKVVD